MNVLRNWTGHLQARDGTRYPRSADRRNALRDARPETGQLPAVVFDEETIEGMKPRPGWRLVKSDPRNLLCELTIFLVVCLPPALGVGTSIGFPDKRCQQILERNERTARSRERESDTNRRKPHGSRRPHRG